MSYDIHLVDPVTKHVLAIPEGHNLRGGIFASGGTTEAWLNITYNYSWFFKKTLGEKGIRVLYGKTGAECIPLLESAIAELGTTRASDYWEVTPGNAGAALADLLELCRKVPHGILDGD